MNRIYIKTKIFYGENALAHLNAFRNSKIWIICDKFLMENGRLREMLEMIHDSNPISLFSDVVPDPPLTVIGKGVAIMAKLQPDVVIAYGGGSAIDTAKGIIHFAREMKIAGKVKLIAVPTTSGTGSEVTSATVITDTDTKVKHIMFDDGMLPDEAILDARLTLTVPPEITANTGMDVLTHALEAYVSNGAGDYSDAMAEKSVELVIASLLKCYYNGADEKARAHMHCASNLAGIAFNTAGLGINHSIAHQLGDAFHIPHGLANAMLLNTVIEYNCRDEGTLTKYAAMVYKTGMVERSPDHRFAVSVLLQLITSLKKTMDMPMTLKAYGITRHAVEEAKSGIAENAVRDLCSKTNPRQATRADIEALLDSIYE